MKYLLCYGTLRRGCALFGCLGDQTYIKTIRLKGYSMYSLGGCPAVVKDDSKNEIVTELHSISNETAERIRDMELGAGYDELKIYIRLGNGKSVDPQASLYVYDYKYIEGARQIPDGDWAKHCKRHAFP